MNRTNETIADRYFLENERMLAAVSAGNYMAARKHELRARRLILKARETTDKRLKGNFAASQRHQRLMELFGTTNVEGYREWLYERGATYCYYPEGEESGNIAAHVRYREYVREARAFRRMMEVHRG